MLYLPARCTYSNLSRCSGSSERRFRRWAAQEHDLIGLHQSVLEHLPGKDFTVAAMDTVFIPKSGKQTHGLGRFWNGCNKRTERDLELSCIGLVHHKEQHSCFALSCEQTLPAVEPGDLMDPYIAQLRSAAPFILPYTKRLAADGAYARKSFMQAAVEMGFTVITRLRKDANLRFLYHGKQLNKSGRKKCDNGKVDFSRRSKMQRVKTKINLAEGCKAYTCKVNATHMGLDLKIVVVYGPDKNHLVYCSTDLKMSAAQIFTAYAERFQIELLFRDAKQFTGLSQCQVRSNSAIRLHANAALAAVGIAKADMAGYVNRKAAQPFSLQDYKTRQLNEYQLWRVLSNFDIDPKLILSHPNYERFIRAGCIAA